MKRAIAYGFFTIIFFCSCLILMLGQQQVNQFTYKSFPSAGLKPLLAGFTTAAPSVDNIHAVFDGSVDDQWFFFVSVVNGTGESIEVDFSIRIQKTTGVTAETVYFGKKTILAGTIAVLWKDITSFINNKSGLYEITAWIGTEENEVKSKVFIL